MSGNIRNISPHLYAIAGWATRRVKIGRAAHPLQRYHEMCSTSPDPLVLLCWAENLGSLERPLHVSLDRYRLHGEWFDRDITAEIASVVTDRPPLPSAAFARWAIDRTGGVWREIFVAQSGQS